MRANIPRRKNRFIAGAAIFSFQPVAEHAQPGGDARHRQHLRADGRHKRGLDAFDSGNMTEAWRAETAAVEANPLVDIYRCSASDVAIWGGGPASGAIVLLEDGLDLEPHGRGQERAALARDLVPQSGRHQARLDEQRGRDKAAGGP